MAIRGGSTSTALSSIAPALASTACCWGPAVLGIFGATSSSSGAYFSQIARFRPQLLALSATMITFSFYRVYGPPSRQEHACCKSEAEKQDDAKKLKINRIVVWISLCVALAGASYGRVQVPQLSRVGMSNWIGGGAQSTASSCAAAPLQMQVQGMSCGGCASKVSSAIRGVDGVQNVLVDYKTGVATVEGININEKAIRTAIKNAGYVVT